VRFEGFVGETYQARSPNANAERCVNLFPEVTGGSGKSKIHYLHTPGLGDFITIPGGGPVRCLWAGDDRLLAVAGTSYGEIFPTGPTFTPLGAVASDYRPARIYSNGSQIVIVSGDHLYCDNGEGPILQTIPTLVSSATYLDGYFIALEKDSNFIYVSALLNGLSWNPVDLQQRLSSPDRIVAIASDRKLLWLFGKRTIDLWYNSGNADFPFEPVQGGGIHSGTCLPDTIAKLNGSFFFATEDENGGVSIVRTEGTSLRRVSTHAIEARISTNANAYLLRAWAYSEGGHPFYVLTEPTGIYTHAYDVATNFWHERAYWNGTIFDPHLAQYHAYTTPEYGGLGGVHFVGSRLDGKVYRQSMNLYTDAGAAIRRYRQAPHLATGETTNFYHAFHLDTPLGPAGVTLKWSDDDGATWTAGKVPTVTAATADRKQRLTWRRLGESWDRIFAVTLHGINAPVAINDAFLEVTKGTGA
jgi:hypothetical protein